MHVSVIKAADSSFFGYKTHIAMSDERLITAAIVTTGEKSDGKYLQELIEKSQETGMEIETVIGDTAYSEKDNIRYAKENKVQLVVEIKSAISHMEVERKKMNLNLIKMPVCMFVKQDIWLFEKHEQERKTRGVIKYRLTYFDIEKCKVCPLREGCYKEGAKSKTYSVTIKSTEHKDQEAFQNSEEFKEKAKSRYKIEAKNSELKHRHGYDTANSAGLFGMEMQGAMTIFAVNLKRIMTLIKESE